MSWPPYCWPCYSVVFPLKSSPRNAKFNLEVRARCEQGSVLKSKSCEERSDGNNTSTFGNRCARPGSFMDASQIPPVCVHRDHVRLCARAQRALPHQLCRPGMDSTSPHSSGFCCPTAWLLRARSSLGHSSFLRSVCDAASPGCIGLWAASMWPALLSALPSASIFRTSNTVHLYNNDPVEFSLTYRLSLSKQGIWVFCTLMALAFTSCSVRSSSTPGSG